MNVHPAMPPASGPNASKVRFYSEVAMGFELLALFYALREAEQREMIAKVRELATAAANGGAS